MKKIALAALLVLLAGVVMAADCQVSLTWDGRQTDGQMEGSLPVTFTVFDADTNLVLSTAQVVGRVTDYAMPSFTVTVAPNTTKVLSVYATAKDSVGNESARSVTVSTTLVGADTSSPAQPVINITIQE
jgi:hypothetical protein